MKILSNEEIKVLEIYSSENRYISVEEFNCIESTVDELISRGLLGEEIIEDTEEYTVSCWKLTDLGKLALICFYAYKKIV